jgi:transmembrane sensor
MSNVTQFTNPEQVKHEAGAWLARLDKPPLSEIEREQLRRWLATSKFHEEYLHRLTDNWNRMDALSELAPLFPLKAEESDYQPGWQRFSGWIAVSAMAAMVLLAVGLNDFQAPGQVPAPKVSTTTFKTAVGEIVNVELPDGSSVKLNTNSLMEVDFDDHLRTVTLLRGEANFKVASNPLIPFVVQSGTGTVWAVGTQFNVRLLSSAVDVTVTEGLVKVIAGMDMGPEQGAANDVHESAERQVMVQAGQSVRYNQVIETPEIHIQEELVQKLAWQQGSLIFRGESLQEAIAEISRYTEQQLVIVDPAINNIPIGGLFKTDDIEGLIVALNRNFNIRSEQISPNLIHLSRQ